MGSVTLPLFLSLTGVKRPSSSELEAPSYHPSQCLIFMLMVSVLVLVSVSVPVAGVWCRCLVSVLLALVDDTRFEI